jgi:ribosomal protein RSM22 (predicted rRNA methylase)
MDALTRLHLGLTRERRLVGTDYLDDPELLAAYRQHFAPMSRAKALAVLREVCDPAAPPRRVLDVGAGPGAMAQAARELFPQAAVVACDRSLRALEVVPAGIERVRWDAARDPAPAGLGRGDVVLLGNVLNELPGDSAAHLERLAAAALAPGGMMVIIEPALRETARALEGARDRLVERGWFVVAPCLFRGGCPALSRERDWCHEDRSTTQGDETLKFSYLVLRREGRFSEDARRFRVVSERMREKGREKLWACGVRGRFLVTRLDRQASPANDAWGHLARGDVVELDDLEERRPELRVGPRAAVRVVLPVVR